MIQIHADRSFTNENGQIIRHFKAIDQYESINQLFKTVDIYLNTKEEREKYNLHYTIAHVLPGSLRTFQKQSIIPFDIDHCGHKFDPTPYIKIFEEKLKLDMTKVGIVMSGHGMHFLVEPEGWELTEVKQLKDFKPVYTLLCDVLDKAIKKAGLEGKMDRGVIKPAQTLRLPKTRNVKEGMEPVLAELLNDNIEVQEWDFESLLEIGSIHPDSFVSEEDIKKYPSPDDEYVMQECRLLCAAKEDPNALSYQQWYSIDGIMGRLKNGRKLVHEYSKGHDSYNEETTDSLLDNALAFGPRKCSTIGQHYEGCAQCPHYGTVTTPLQLQGPDYIKTKGTGFYTVILNENGSLKSRKPEYDDLVKFFKQTHEYCVRRPGKAVMTFTGTHWEQYLEQDVEHFAHTHFDPPPSTNIVKEFKARLIAMPAGTPPEFFVPRGKVNFRNGVYDINTGEMEPHSTEYGFTFTLEYDYTPGALCPRFKKFLEEVTDGADAANLLIEYLGYIISGADPAIFEKALILKGGGSNGKSVYLDVVEKIMGPSATHLSAENLSDEKSRMDLEKSCVNVVREVPAKKFVSSEIFKTIVTGEPIRARFFRKDGITIRPFTKLVFSANDIPKLDDSTGGMLRRFLVIPFDRQFTDENKDTALRGKLFDELPGIIVYAMESFRILMARKKFIIPKSSLEEVATLRRISSSVYAFIDDQDYVYFDRDAYAKSRDVYSKYTEYCRDANMRPESKVWFSRKFLESTRKRGVIGNVTKAIEKKYFKCFEGIGIKGEFHPPTKDY